MTAQILEISGQKMVMLPIADYERLVDLAEDRLDVASAAAAEQRRANGEHHVPIEVVDRLIAGENPLRVWRKHRGMTQQQLGEAVGISHNQISRIENEERPGNPRVWKAVAKALGVQVDDLMPSSNV